jgi:hypothetical protein
MRSTPRSQRATVLAVTPKRSPKWAWLKLSACRRARSSNGVMTGSNDGAAVRRPWWADPVAMRSLRAALYRRV